MTSHLPHLDAHFQSVGSISSAPGPKSLSYHNGHTYIEGGLIKVAPEGIQGGAAASKRENPLSPEIERAALPAAKHIDLIKKKKGKMPDGPFEIFCVILYFLILFPLFVLPCNI